MSRSKRPSELVSSALKARMLEAQDGRCAICGNPPRSRALHIDHDHRTGRIRGAICFRCNRLLLTRGVTPTLLASAAAYLSRETDYGTLP